jgi:cytochrome P450
MTATLDIATPRHIDILEPGFKITDDAVLAAREADWYATTNYGIAVLRYEDVAELIRSPHMTQGSAKWPDHHGVHSGAFYDWWSKNLLVLEGEEHERLRRLLNPAFSPKAAKQLEPVFYDLANELIDQWIDDGQTEFVQTFSDPYACRVVCLLLGIDQSEHKYLGDLGAVIGLSMTVDIGRAQGRIDAAIEELKDYVEQLIEARTAEPKEDIVTVLIGEADKGERLTQDELRNLLVLAIFGAMDTTRNQLGLAMQSFINQPDQFELLASDPAKHMSMAAEEVLRTNPTTRWITREAAEDFTYKGLLIEQGTTVHLFTHAAGTDPRKFACPHLNLEGEFAPNFGFGGGPHQCLGRYIAKTDVSIALSTLATRIKHPRNLPGAEWSPDSGNHGPTRLPISFERR